MYCPLSLFVTLDLCTFFSLFCIYLYLHISLLASNFPFPLLQPFPLCPLTLLLLVPSGSLSFSSLSLALHLSLSHPLLFSHSLSHTPFLPPFTFTHYTHRHPLLHHQILSDVFPFTPAKRSQKSASPALPTHICIYLYLPDLTTLTPSLIQQGTFTIASLPHSLLTRHHRHPFALSVYSGIKKFRCT